MSGYALNFNEETGLEPGQDSFGFVLYDCLIYEVVMIPSAADTRLSTTLSSVWHIVFLQEHIWS